MHDFSKVDKEISMSQARDLLTTGAQKLSFLAEHRQALEEAARRGDKTIMLGGTKFRLTYGVGKQARLNPVLGYTPCGWFSY